MTLVDAMLRACKYYMDNLSEIVVNRIRSQYRHDLRIENGAGASILLTGDQVLINGLTSGGAILGENDRVVDRLYFGADLLCWIERNPNNGNLTFHTAPGKMVEFERG